MRLFSPAAALLRCAAVLLAAPFSPGFSAGAWVTGRLLSVLAVSGRVGVLQDEAVG